LSQVASLVYIRFGAGK